MKYRRRITGRFAGIATLALLTACGDSTTEQPALGELVVLASASVPPASSASSELAVASVPVGAPSSWRVGIFSFHVSANADCSSPVTVYDSGSSARVTDFTTNPQLFRAGAVPVGTYPCVAMRISDVMEFESAVSSGGCSTGVTYRGDIYRAGAESEPFLDLNLVPITATGSESAPSEDGVYVLFTTNPSAARGRGFAQNQTATLSTPLVIPDQITFVWDASNAVSDAGTRCTLEPEAPALFR